jgi:Ca2+-binding EF-hand superfamily protein
VKTNGIFAWIIGFVLIIGAFASITTASGQQAAMGTSGAKLWMSAMDKDNDGSVSKQEFLTYMETQFDKADVDHDGTLDKNDIVQLRKNWGIASTDSGKNTSANPPGAKLSLTAMDKDHDGTVSKQEFTAYMEAQFDKADTDHDGTVDRNEMEQLRKNLGFATKQ